MFDFEEELKKLPHVPGVYLMHNKSDQIIYVGKAIDLYNRVHQYFQSGYKKSPKIEKMVAHIAWFEYIVCDSEIEALVLECNLIKEHRPRYNTMLTDDKGYPYIKITVEEDYPRILYSHQMKRDRSKYFGPYTNTKAVKDIIDLLRKLFRIRNCNKNLPKEIGMDRPCLYHQIGQCDAPCQGYISKEEYREKMNQAISFLNGNHSHIVRELEQRMKSLAADMEFEQAAEIRDLIQSIHHISTTQRVSDVDSDDRDIIAMATDSSNECVISIFFVRQGKLIGREHYHMSGVNAENYGTIMEAFLKQYYASTPYLPKEVIIEQHIDDYPIIEEYLSSRRGSQVKITVPQKGDKKKLLKLAGDNARLVMNQDAEKLKREQARTEGAARELADLLGVSSAKRLEAFDISHISGYHSVASMVVFENGRPKKNDYRKFRLKTIDGPDDYASMREVLTRRFTDQRFRIFPDILMMDGGKGQVNIALEVLSELKLNIPVCGMVKDDFHRTRGLYFNNKEISFFQGSEVFNMITRLQDEAHRFAIEYHRSLRSSSQIHSILDDIDGIGPSRRKALLAYYKNIDNIKAADITDLEKVPSMNKASAKAVYSFFHKEDNSI
ncbi:MAG: excinuclease ABC subunit UvrC [Coprococcus sp.]|nr:excinuclease ABC subunit UvrC [Coprococcus sp.]